MEDITKTLEFGRGDALAYIRDTGHTTGQIQFVVYVKIRLPTEDGHGIDSSAKVFVSREQALSVVKQSYPKIFENRGGKVQIVVDQHSSINTAFITIGGFGKN